ncbi:pre-rRNA processing protein [Massospora cicadina]|nr:pre-rRNA processing protein [Massospora cicadina]
MEDTFVRIRSQVASKLDHQKQVAIALQVIEEALESQGQPKIPAAYFAILLNLLEQDEGNTRPALMYLLDVVFKELPENLLRAKADEIIRIFLIVLGEDAEKAPVIRSATGCLETLLKAQDRASWSRPKLREGFRYLVERCADPRPKVRRRAHDAVASVLETSKSSVAVAIATDFCLNQLKRIRKSSASSASNEAVPFLSFLKRVSVHWNPQDLQKLSGPLLALTKLNNAFITTLGYQTLATVIARLEPSQFEAMLEAIIATQPNYNETDSYCAWLMSIREGFSGLFSKTPQRFFSAMPALLDLLLKDLEGPNLAANQRIGETVSELILSLDVEALGAMGAGQVQELDAVLERLQNCLTYRFRNAWPHLFRMLQGMYRVFGSIQPKSLGEEGFEFKAEVDAALGAAIASLGPRQFLAILPLNLERPGHQTMGRAWLLPVLKEHVNNAEFGFFADELLALADRLEERAKAFAGNEVLAKIYATLCHQVWSLFPSFASFPVGLQVAFTQPFAERVAAKIYTDAELRPILFNGLALLIESNRRASGADGAPQRYPIDPATAQANLAHLAKFATNYLMVLFNIYSAASPNMRTLVLKVVLTFLAVSPAEQVEAAFTRVAAMLGPNPAGEAVQTCAVMLDLAMVMIPYLQASSVGKLFELSVRYLPGGFDGSLQKRAYKAMSKLLDTWPQVVLPRLGGAESVLLDVGIDTDSCAVKDRMGFLSRYIRQLPASNLHVVSRLVSEVILGAKEVNEKARESAFEVLVVMGEKMAAGGQVDGAKLEAALPGETASASLEEFMRMVLAGLTAKTPHMISATISALSRLLFEFHSQLGFETVSDLIKTIELFVGSNNREIVKAALGFVKVATVALDARHLQPHLPMLLSSILAWSNDNQSRFKVKVRHIIERLIRRFGIETVEGAFPEKHVKLIANIRRRKLRAKRQAKPPEPPKPALGKRTLNNAFDEALYGSESEIESEEVEEPQPGAKVTPILGGLPFQRKSRAAAVTYIRDDQLDEAPIDFLDRAAISRISALKPKPATLASAKLDSAFTMSEDGRLGEDFYKQSINSGDGFTRVNNRIKFHKGRAEEGSDTEAQPTNPSKRPKPATHPRREYGGEFKAKKAEGDVKRKGQLDPYTYIPLDPRMVANRGKIKSRLAILKRRLESSRACLVMSWLPYRGVRLGAVCLPYPYP